MKTKLKKMTLADIVAKLVQSDVDAKTSDLFNIAKNAKVKINSLRRLLNKREATTQTIEALLEHYKVPAVSAVHELGVYHLLSVALEDDDSLNDEQKQFIFEHCKITFDFAKRNWSSTLNK